MIELWGEICWPTVEMRTILTFLVQNQSLAILLSTPTPDLPHLVVATCHVRTYICMHVCNGGPVTVPLLQHRLLNACTPASPYASTSLLVQLHMECGIPDEGKT